MKRLLAVAGILVGLTGFTAWTQEPPPVTSEYRDAFTKVLEFLYTVAHWIGQVVANLVHSIVPTVIVPSSLVDAIGFLGLLTVFLAVAEIAKRLVWIVVAVGWILIVIRMVMVALQGS